MDRLLRGIICTVLFYFGGLFLLGAVVGGIAGYREPHNAQAAGRLAGEQAGLKYGKLIGYTALAFGAFSALVGSPSAQSSRGW